MRVMNATSFTPSARDWLASARHPRILHIFDHACNLIDERGEVLSVVSSQIGNGPFNMVLDKDVVFSELLTDKSTIIIQDEHLTIGGLNISMNNAAIWNPTPPWETLRTKRTYIAAQLPSTQSLILQSPFPQSSNSLITSLIIADIPASLESAKSLAGLGIGLTPAGDDFILGAILAVWMIHPCDVACRLTKEITDAAAPLTTSLSAAYLKSASRGEAGILWHELFEALIAEEDIKLPIENLLSVGETSGADALAGFIGVMRCYKERQQNHVSAANSILESQG